ncbi:hypothetical protein ACFQL7_20905 [Halocatena marina]|uniref:t-SNARE coiled-coil homology domain-containing protein n=1 Tax=Halocatena marina TaxID=2934937 RepID=A0ABD5YRI2_9EURY|nr:hypothetical protein [Halocatena marina]
MADSDSDNNDDVEALSVWHRVDERTKRMDDRLGRIDEKIYRMEDQIIDHDRRMDTVEQRVNRNTTILSAVTFGLASVLTFIIDKLGGVLKI